MTPVAPTPTPPVKPGIKTTEFWVTLLTALSALVTLFWPGHDFSQYVQIGAVVAASIASSFYSHSRGQVKSTLV